MSIITDELIEQLADAEHASWARWMDYLFTRCDRLGSDEALTIPADLVKRWRRQVDTPYADLSEREKQSDREEVALILPLIEAAHRRAAAPAQEAVALLNSMLLCGESHSETSRAAVRRAMAAAPRPAGQEEPRP